MVSRRPTAEPSTPCWRIGPIQLITVGDYGVSLKVITITTWAAIRGEPLHSYAGGGGGRLYA
jgi:hypothetical protein